MTTCRKCPRESQAWRCKHCLDRRLVHNTAGTDLVPQVFQYLDLHQRLMVKALLVSDYFDSHVAAHFVVKTPEHLQAPRTRLRLCMSYYGSPTFSKHVGTCTNHSMQAGTPSGWL